jgi:condensation domain-containing protein
MSVGELDRRLATLSPEKRALVERALKRRREQTGSQTIPRRSGSGPAPLSYSQQRIWFLEQWEPGGFTHNGSRAFRLSGSVDARTLEQAINGVVERHEVLRTIYVMEKREPKQVLLDSWRVDLPVVDLQSNPEPERELERQLRELSREPFDLGADLMIRATLFRLGPDDHALLIRLHHIAFDAFSDRVFFSELFELYSAALEGRVSTLSDPPIQYADFAVWQRERLQGPLLEELVAYWRTQLTGGPAVLRLPTDRPRRALQRHEGRHHPLSLPEALARGTADVGRSEGATPYMTLLAAFASLLYRVSGQDDIVIGSPIACRTHVELERLIGFFSNTVALRIPLSGNPTFREVLRRTREAALGAYAHQELPFDKVVEELRVPRDPSYNPVFQVNFRVQSDDVAPIEFAGVDAAPIVVDIGFSRFDLAVELQLDRQGIGGYIEHDRDLFDHETVEHLAADLEGLLGQVLVDPDRPLLAVKLQGPWRRSSAATAASLSAPIPRARDLP